MARLLPRRREPGEPYGAAACRRAVSSERLWLSEPRRATCLATVTGVRGDAFTVDRCLFAPASKALRHPQPADQGVAVVGGDKRVLSAVFERDGDVWLRLRGFTPTVGDRLQCQLDRDVRDLASRAHTALHLLLAALRKERAPPLPKDPEVKGGGHARLSLAAPAAPELLARALAQANAWAAADLGVEREHASRDVVARVATPQAFDPPDPYPGGDVVPIVRIGEACAYPCDGTHVERTHKVGRIVLPQVSPARGGMTVVLRVR